MSFELLSLTFQQFISKIMWSVEVVGSNENHFTGVPHDSDQWNSSDRPNPNPKYVCREGGSRFSNNFFFQVWPFLSPDFTFIPQKLLSKILSKKMIKKCHSICDFRHVLCHCDGLDHSCYCSWCHGAQNPPSGQLPSSSSMLMLSSWPIPMIIVVVVIRLVSLIDNLGIWMSRIKGSNLIFPLRLKGVKCVWISVILGTQGRRGIPVPIYLRRMAQ